MGYGAMLALTVGGNCPGLAAENPGLQKFLLGAVGLPTGLLMVRLAAVLGQLLSCLELTSAHAQVLVCGAELFTSNAAMLPAAVYERRATLSQLLRNWSISYSGVLPRAVLIPQRKKAF